MTTASHSHKERAALCHALLKRGHPVEGKDLTKALRRVRSAAQPHNNTTSPT